MKLRYSAITFALVALALTVDAQDGPKQPSKAALDSIKMSYMEQEALRTPMIRQASISVEGVKTDDFNAKLYGKDFVKGDAKTVRNQAEFRLPSVKWGANSLTLTMGYTTQKIFLSNLYSTMESTSLPNYTIDASSMRYNLSYNRLGKLFGRTTTYNLSFSSSSTLSYSQYDLGINGLVMMNLHKTRSSSLSVGAGVVITAHPIFPVFLLISYYRRFEDADAELTLNLPYYVCLRKIFTPRCSFGIVNELTSSNGYVNLDSKLLPPTGKFNSMAIKLGAQLEYRATKKLVLGAYAGAMYNGPTRMFHKKGLSDGTSFIRVGERFDPYVKVGISFLPFFL